MGKQVILYAHGNASFLAEAQPFKQMAVAAHWDVISVGYRGYPGSDGKPSEAGLAMDIRAAYRFVVETMGVPPARIVLHGRSLGGGVVGTLIDEVEIGGLVLESTFTSAVDLAAEIYWFVPVRALMINRFQTLERASNFDGPVIIFHSVDDEVIPVAHGRRLHAGISHSQYVEVSELGHNMQVLDWHSEARRVYISFLDEVQRNAER